MVGEILLDFIHSTEFVFTQGIEVPAFILGALTAGGGITGYIRTGSIPSVTAGVTVGALVSSLSLSSSQILRLTFVCEVWTRWFPNAEASIFWG
jgi:hypothetical protein